MHSKDSVAEEAGVVSREPEIRSRSRQELVVRSFSVLTTRSIRAITSASILRFNSVPRDAKEQLAKERQAHREPNFPANRNWPTSA